MKPKSVLLIPMVLFLIGATAEAQQRSPNPQGQRGAGADSPPALLDLLNLLEASQQGTLGARGGGGRGPVDPGVETQLRELERFINRAGAPVVVTVVSGAWWSNATLGNQLGLTDDQKAKILKSFENHRLTLESNKASLEKEESQLARLLEADAVDRNAAIAQIYRVASARAEMERTNATMTLEMREHLTRAQWTQLQAQSNATMRINPPAARGGLGAGERGARGVQQKF
jgi:Spy/CpxP family protein refolding chaperone